MIQAPNPGRSETRSGEPTGRGCIEIGGFESTPDNIARCEHFGH